MENQQKVKIKTINFMKENFKIAFTLKFLISFLLFIVFLLSFLSNYQSSTILIKSSISIILIFILIIYTKNRKHISGITIYEWIFILFYCYLAISLLWSSNKSFGLLKIIQITLLILPFWIAIRSNLIFEINRELSVVFNLFLIFNIVLAIYIIFAKPVEYSEIGLTYKKLSGVISGRFQIISILLVVFYLQEKYSKTYISIILLLIFTIALGTVAFRAGLIAIFVMLFLNTLLSFRKNFFKYSYIFLNTLILGIFLSLILNQNLINRLEWLSDIKSNQEIIDNSITARIESYKTSVAMFIDKPLLGQGLGGFNSLYEGSQIGINIKYPHNIFLELLSETGVIGTILFSTALILSLINLYKINQISLLLFFLLLLILSFFSKDISTNIILIAPLFFPKEKLQL